ncbi:MerR family transcriptional regulator [Duganella sp. FT109W]|uniref:MerR family transcriptional regulator n=1 Tax=Duganella margarita TaxID=2692170 RepID=A0ABW9WH03_9BURK|nr:MerR family transcriptional regulator [Duganella margarita]MYN40426.1 MerR family transcriptional regulator [Duganella margarita]
MNQKMTKGYRSGVAARLAGLPVETLRVWERRYGVSDADRSPQGQRLYSAEQVYRLGLLKRVVDQGHAIGTVARMDVDELAGLAGVQPGTGVQSLKLAVVGAALAQRLSAARTAPLLEIVAACAQLDDAERGLAGARADVLLIEAPEMTADAMPRIRSLRRAIPARATVVLYRFCDSATVRRLREHGCLVARSPSDASEVAMLCNTAVTGAALPPPGPTRPAAPRRLNDEELAALTAASSSINCECPRHLADILLMLSSFERYSAQCAHRNATDAAMHEDLARSAGHARMLMEDALERLAYAEGLPMPAR